MIYNITNDAELRTSISSARSGDTLSLSPGQYVGPFSLSAGVTVTTKDYTKQNKQPSPDLNLAKIVSPARQSGDRALLLNDNVTLRGLDVSALRGNQITMLIHTNTSRNIDQSPKNVLVEECRIHSGAGVAREGIRFNCRNSVLRNNIIDNILDSTEAYAVNCYTADNCLIERNYLASAGMSVFLGVGMPYQNSPYPSRIAIINNTISRNFQWKENGWNSKHLIEVKGGNNIIIRENRFSNLWKGSGVTDSCVIYLKTNFSPIHHFLIEDNVAINCQGTFLKITNQDSPIHDIICQNNSFDVLNHDRNRLVVITGKNNKSIIIKQLNGHYAEQANADLYFQAGPIVAEDIMFEECMWDHGSKYGIKGDGKASGQDSIDYYTKGFNTSLFVVKKPLIPILNEPDPDPDPDPDPEPEPDPDPTPEPDPDPTPVLSGLTLTAINNLDKIINMVGMNDSWFMPVQKMQTELVTLWEKRFLDIKPVPVEKEFYVDIKNGNDNNSGTKDNPWKTINKAVNKIHPGDKIVVLPGLYKESIQPTVSGTIEKPIKIFGLPGVIITGEGNYRWQAVDISHWLVDGLTFIDYVGGGMQWRSDGTDVSSITLSNLQFRNQTGVSKGLQFISRTEGLISNVTAKKINFQNISTGARSENEVMPLRGNISGFILDDIMINGCSNIGIDLIGRDEDHGQPRHGKIINCNVASVGQAGGNSSGIYLDGAGENIVIEHNEVQNCPYGITVNVERNAPTLITKNISINDNNIFNCQYGLKLGAGGHHNDPNDFGRVIDVNAHKNSVHADIVCLYLNFIEQCDIMDNTFITNNKFISHKSVQSPLHWKINNNIYRGKGWWNWTRFIPIFENYQQLSGQDKDSRHEVN